MSKSYSPVSDDVLRIMQSVRDDYHSPDLDGVTVAARFVYDDASTEPVLKHGGYPAQAVVRITPVQDRAMGMADAVITIDRSNWCALTQEQREALIDHELYHLDRVTSGETKIPQIDAVDRPKLRIRPHDQQLGVFTAILERHGKHSAESRMIKALADATGQLYWDFSQPVRAPSAQARPQLKAVN